ncbi:RecQ family ATP-dependent DNA helicase [Lunatimonas salinarum]|uniref:RecQ family ATP-dependent DNA helicase n=1 Tax=Lunatimonas salinarum TaxID=1774590 RepID=UPI001ADF2D4B|nr:ATP-dependent DNA helicase RecQ [Lunatimonas salinarum]
MAASKETALQVLKSIFGFSDFRPLQEEIVLSVAGGRDTFAILPTGGGKSLCFQVPALMHEGICLVVSPLIALMKDQVDNLKKKGVKAVAVYSGMRPREIDVLLDNCIYGEVKFLYVSPERLKTDLFLERFRQMKVSMIAVDEAHCISQWGYDFRPPYLEIAALREIHPQVPFIALTASATLDVQKDIIDKLELKDCAVFAQSAKRRNISFVAREAENKFEKAWEVLKKVQGSAILYVRNRKGTKEMSDQLNRLGISATYYHAGLNSEERSVRQVAWINGKVRVMVATNAFGMGIDKPDVRVVIHLDLPENLENYYQEAGRAGRDGFKAFAVLYYSLHDIAQLQERAAQTYPSLEFIRKVYQSLANHYRIAVGSSEMSSFDFDLHSFTQTYQLDALLTYNALKVMQEESLLLLSEGLLVPSTIHIPVSQSQLYEVQVRYASLDPLVKLLLRMYGGELFSGYVKVQEGRLAKALGLSETQIEKMLQKLDSLEVLAYNPRRDQPQVTFLTPRFDAGKLPLNQKRIGHRRDLAVRKARSMAAYAENKQLCRTLVLLDYFGEHTDEVCGICDVCLNRKKLTLDVGSEEGIREKILITLSGGKAFSLRKLLAEAGYNDSLEAAEIVRMMEDEEVITTTADGRIKLKME